MYMYSLFVSLSLLPSFSLLLFSPSLSSSTDHPLRRLFGECQYTVMQALQPVVRDIASSGCSDVPVLNITPLQKGIVMMYGNVVILPPSLSPFLSLLFSPSFSLSLPPSPSLLFSPYCVRPHKPFSVLLMV